jgi:hypothetical protein
MSIRLPGNRGGMPETPHQPAIAGRHDRAVKLAAG